MHICQKWGAHNIVVVQSELLTRLPGSIIAASCNFGLKGKLAAELILKQVHWFASAKIHRSQHLILQKMLFLKLTFREEIIVAKIHFRQYFLTLCYRDQWTVGREKKPAVEVWFQIYFAFKPPLNNQKVSNSACNPAEHNTFTQFCKSYNKKCKSYKALVFFGVGRVTAVKYVHQSRMKIWQITLLSTSEVTLPSVLLGRSVCWCLRLPPTILATWYSQSFSLEVCADRCCAPFGLRTSLALPSRTVHVFPWWCLFVVYPNIFWKVKQIKVKTC